MIFAVIRHRVTGDYWPEDLPCLRCREVVDPKREHLFVRDPSPELGDCEAFIGILHIACTDTYLKDAEAVGLAIRVEDSRVRRAK